MGRLLKVSLAALLALTFLESANASDRWLDAPRVVSFVTPDYPQMAKAACIQGNVAVLVEIAADGVVSHTEVVYGHPLLAPISERAALATRFGSVEAGASARREVLKYRFRILPWVTPHRKVRSTMITPTEVEIRSYPNEVISICDDCPPRGRKQTKQGDCGPYVPAERAVPWPRPN